MSDNLMSIVSIRDLSRRPAGVLDQLARSGRPTVVTRKGRPVAALVALDAAGLEDYVLATAPEFVRAMRRATADLAAGRVTAAAAVFAEAEGATPRSRRPAAQPRSPEHPRSRPPRG